MTNKERFIEIYKTKIHREGSEKLLEFLMSKNSDFFEAPASTRFHGSYEGGLLEHSLNVYDCLLDTRVSEILGDEKAKEVEENLSNNRNTFLRKISDLGLTLENINQDFGLTELERKVFDERFFSPDTSLTSMEEKFQMSKSALLKHENKAIAKIEKGLGRNK